MITVVPFAMSSGVTSIVFLCCLCSFWNLGEIRNHNFWARHPNHTGQWIVLDTWIPILVENRNVYGKGPKLSHKNFDKKFVDAETSILVYIRRSLRERQRQNEREDVGKGQIGLPSIVLNAN